MKTLVLISGGIDSALMAYLARDEGEICLFHISHGSNTYEENFANGIANWLGRGIEHITINLPPSKEPDKTNFIPFRNQVLLSLAFAHALDQGCDQVGIGANYDDFNDYPDCRPDWFGRFERLSSAYAPILIYAPLLYYDKMHVVSYAIHKGIPLELTFTCYTPVFQGDKILACGACNSCKLRLKSFDSLSIKDPIEYVQS